MRRVLVIGCPGAGKSTLARQIGERLGLPVIHLDREYFGPGWKMPDKAAWRDNAVALAARPQWVMDGNYSSTFDIRVPRATDVVWVDTPRWLCLLRVVTRVLRHWGEVRPDLAPGCPERFDWSFMVWVWNFPNRTRPKLARMMKALSAPQRAYIVRKKRDLADLHTRLAQTSERP